MTDATVSTPLRRLDRATLERTKSTERFSQRLLDRTTGGDVAAIIYVRTPPGGGSPSGRHVHDVDQLLFVLEGVVGAEVDGVEVEAHPGDLVVIPAGVPHRNWAVGDAPATHVEVKAPAPDPSLPGSRPAS